MSSTVGVGVPAFPGPGSGSGSGSGVGLGTLGRYRLCSELGRGGMGVVYLAIDERGRAVALKVLRDHVTDDPAARARLSREVEHLSRIRHRGVAQILDSDVEGSRPYVVTRYVPGPSLDRYVAQHGPLLPEALLSLAQDLSDALSAVHVAGVVHRDLKPANVLLHDGRPVLIDFGIAHGADDARITATGLVMGTPGFLAPEILDGAKVTVATDWWAWAATLAFAASGRVPFGEGPVDAVLARIRAGECDLTGVDPALAPLLRAALDPRPTRRPTQERILTDLATYASGGPATQALPPLPTTQVIPEVPRTAPVQAVPVQAVPVQAVPVQGALGPGVAPPAVAPPPSVHPPVGPQQRTAFGGSTYGRTGFPPRRPIRERGPAAPYAAWTSVPPPQAPVTPAAGPAMAPSGAPVAPSGAPVADPARGPVAAPPGVASVGPGARRTGVLVAMAALFAALALVAPVLALGAGIVWSWLARTVERAVVGLSLRRGEYGARRGDVAGAVLRSPAYAVGAALASIFGAILPTLVGGAAVVGGIALQGAGVVPGAASDPSAAAPLLAAAAAAMVVAWWGPGGSSVRRGTRVVVRWATPGRHGSVVVTGVVLLVAAVIALISQSSGFQPSWAPLGGDPFDWVRGVSAMG